MRAIKISLVLVFSLLGVFVGSVRADEVMNVTVPFAFVVGHQLFPAGRYEVSDVMGGNNVFAIESAGDPAGGVAMTMPANGRDPAGEQPALVFHRYENTYRLTQIWESGTNGRALTGLPSQIRGAAHAGLTSSEPSTFVVSAN